MKCVFIQWFILFLQYDKVGKLTREFEPYKNLWITAADWQKWYETWMNDSLINIDPELLANSVSNAFKTMHKSLKHFKSVILVASLVSVLVLLGISNAKLLMNICMYMCICFPQKDMSSDTRECGL